MTGPISFRPTPPTATPTTSTPIQRSAPVNAPPAPPPPPPVRSPQAFQRSAATSGARPLDLQAEAASINTAITQANPEQIQANAARLNQLGLVPQGMPGITPEALQMARQNLKPVSQHQVLNLHDAHESDASRNTVVESGRSVKLKQGGSPFGVGIVLKPGATIEVLGHGSPDGKTIGGKTPQQLAKQLKAGGATQLAVLDLKSCHSEAFKAELQQCLASEGIQVGQIKTYQGSIAVDRATGNALSQQQILTSPVPVKHDGFLDLTEDQKTLVKDMFSGAYETATFKRKAFSDQDRMGAWLEQAHAEAEQLGVDPISKAEVLDLVKDMGLTVKGIHLRHMVPYSDIAGLMRVATSDSTANQVSPEFQAQVREKVTQLVSMIGSPESQATWDRIKDVQGLLRTAGGRETVKTLYRDLAHSQSNLFQGGGSVNSSLSNRPDFPEAALANKGEQFCTELAIWHHQTMCLLGLESGFKKVEISVNIDGRKGKLETLMSGHDLSRFPKGIYADTEQNLVLELPHILVQKGDELLLEAPPTRFTYV